ncbi:MAG: DNA starvation/stationary phase protection protein [Streptococcaceae bacterium]|jgi:starvation-inducible DNA-binding protein|nr:DNA starvation/stationary phase protection protein [Streptococcaceae bacterium]
MGTRTLNFKGGRIMVKYEKTKEILNQSVADISKAAALVHQVHWYMRGPGFMNLHPKMDDLMDELNDFLDELSERLITLGGSPYSTLKEWDEHSKIKLEVADWNKTIDERLSEIVRAYAYLADLFQEGVDATDEEDDDVTNGLFADAQGAVQKAIWMLQAEMGIAPGIDETNGANLTALK